MVSGLNIKVFCKGPSDLKTKYVFILSNTSMTSSLIQNSNPSRTSFGFSETLTISFQMCQFGNPFIESIYPIFTAVKSPVSQDTDAFVCSALYLWMFNAGAGTSAYGGIVASTLRHDK